MFKLKKKNLIYLAACIFLLSCLFFFSHPLKQNFLNTLKSPLKLFSLLEREIKGIVFYHRNLIQNERLQREADFLRTKLNNARELFLENQRLNTLLSFKHKSPFKVIAARVIARPLDSWSSALVIDKGSYNGIKVGMAAINYLGLVGRVVETSALTSTVLLLNDPNLSVSALVRRTRQEGLVSGTLGQYLIMRYLPLDCDIKVQDEIITSGLSANYPKGLLIGVVADIGKEFSGLSRYCLIKPAVSLTSLEEVLVVAQ